MTLEFSVYNSGLQKVVLSSQCCRRINVFILFPLVGLFHESSFPIFSYPLNDAAETVNEIGASIRKYMGGTSGIL